MSFVDQMTRTKKKIIRKKERMNDNDVVYYLPQCPIPYKLLCRLSSSELKTFKFGVNLISGKTNFKNEFGPLLLPLIVYKHADHSLTICRNKCRHAGGNFIRDIEDLDIVRCSYHGWRLNCRTMEYIQPKNGLKQKELTVQKQSDDDDSLLILEEVLFSPWTDDPQTKEDLEPNELNIQLLNSSSILIRKNFLIDPYLIGPSFGRSYWLIDEVPMNVFDQLKTVNAILLTKYFPNHFNLPTLRELAKRNSQIPIYIPAYSFDRFSNQLKSLGFENIEIIPFGIWKSIDSRSRFLILPDHQHPNVDCSVVYEYKGHLVCYLSDCQNPNGTYLPYTIDVLITKYATHRSSYPLCFLEQFDSNEIMQIQKKKDEDFLQKVIKFIQFTNPSVWMPIGGNLFPLHPNDERFADVFPKANLTSVIETIEKRYPKLKISSSNMNENVHSDINLTQSIDIEPFNFEIYFQWAKFANYDLILHIIETNEDFSITLRECYVDFLDANPTYPESCPSNRNYLRLKIRRSVLQHTFHHGLPWIDIYYGLNGLFYAQPNVYHENFWDHFKYHLPLEPLEFNKL